MDLLCYLCIMFVFAMLSCCPVCSLQPCDYLLEKDEPLGFLVCCVLSLFHIVSRVRCCTRLYRFLIFATLSTFINA